MGDTRKKPEPLDNREHETLRHALVTAAKTFQEQEDVILEIAKEAQDMESGKFKGLEKVLTPEASSHLIRQFILQKEETMALLRRVEGGEVLMTPPDTD